MSVQKKSAGSTIALAAAALLISGMAVTAVPSTAQAEANVKCVGGNSCKGLGSCKTAKNDCKGLNSCKGLGFVMTDSAKACTDKGGKVEG